MMLLFTTYVYVANPMKSQKKISLEEAVKPLIRGLHAAAEEEFFYGYTEFVNISDLDKAAQEKLLLGDMDAVLYEWEDNVNDNGESVDTKEIENLAAKRFAQEITQMASDFNVEFDEIVETITEGLEAEHGSLFKTYSPDFKFSGSVNLCATLDGNDTASLLRTLKVTPEALNDAFDGYPKPETYKTNKKELAALYKRVPLDIGRNAKIVSAETIRDIVEQKETSIDFYFRVDASKFIWDINNQICRSGRGQHPLDGSDLVIFDGGFIGEYSVEEFDGEIAIPIDRLRIDRNLYLENESGFGFVKHREQEIKAYAEKWEEHRLETRAETADPIVKVALGEIKGAQRTRILRESLFNKLKVWHSDPKLSQLDKEYIRGANKKILESLYKKAIDLEHYALLAEVLAQGFEPDCSSTEPVTSFKRRGLSCFPTNMTMVTPFFDGALKQQDHPYSDEFMATYLIRRAEIWANNDLKKAIIQRAEKRNFMSLYDDQEKMEIVGWLTSYQVEIQLVDRCMALMGVGLNFELSERTTLFGRLVEEKFWDVDRVFDLVEKLVERGGNPYLRPQSARQENSKAVVDILRNQFGEEGVARLDTLMLCRALVNLEPAVENTAAMNL